MAEKKSTMESLREWVVEHKLRTVGNNLDFVFYIYILIQISCVSFPDPWCWAMDWIAVEGCLWLSGIAGSFAYNWSQPNMKTSVKIIHARYVSPLPVWGENQKTKAKWRKGFKFPTFRSFTFSSKTNNFAFRPEFCTYFVWFLCYFLPN